MERFSLEEEARKNPILGLGFVVMACGFIYRIDWLAFFGIATRAGVVLARLGQGVVMLGLLVLAMSLLGVVLYPRRHRVFQDLAKYGDVDDMAEQVESDITESGRTLGPWTVGKEWLIRDSLRVHPIKELAWVVAIGGEGLALGTCRVTAGFRSGREVSVNFDALAADTLLATLAERAPWLPRVLSPEARREWTENQPAFLARLDESYRAHRRIPVDDGDEVCFRLSE